MAAPEMRLQYLAAGANRHPSLADWSQSGIFAFGTDRNIAVWRPDASSTPGITALLKGHTEKVYAIKFLPPEDGQAPAECFFSGGGDRSLRMWVADGDGDGGGHVDFRCVQVVEDAHARTVDCIAVANAPAKSGARVVATGGADATIKIWSFADGKLSLQQTIKTDDPKYFPLDLALRVLDEEEELYLLAAAGTGQMIQVFLGGKTDEGVQFSLQATLTGHEGWIRSLDIAPETESPKSDLILASASQDKYIRLWRIHREPDLPAGTASSTSSSTSSYLRRLTNKAHRLKHNTSIFTVTFEALLLGHEDWIYSARWRPRPRTLSPGTNPSPPSASPLQLLSASADNTLCTWEADPTSGIWVSVARLGALSREMGGTTATSGMGGFWTGLWSPDGKGVACLVKTGSWLRWVWEEREMGGRMEERWWQALGVGGHTSAVAGIAWSRGGQFLLSTSKDKTTRMHARWKRDNSSSWHEMSRPQIHGYDLNCIDTLGDTQFVSGADEKLMRVFHEPRDVAGLLKGLSGIKVGEENLPNAANVPVLGLSNKSVEAEASAGEDDQELAGTPAPSLPSAHPPYEDTLSRNTLWPETEKLYGHGYEISCLAVNPSGTLIASACHASSLNHAVIRIFETSPRWSQIKTPLEGHSLTVTRLRFSDGDGGDEKLLSVGRDRAWAVWERKEGEKEFRLREMRSKAHARMLLDGAWFGGGSSGFMTCGRDKCVKVWAEKEGKYECCEVIQMGEPVTAVDCLQGSRDGKLVVAAGTESGKVIIYGLATAGLKLVSTINVDERLCPSSTVSQLAWRPSEDCQLAVASEDGSLRICDIPEL